MFLIFSIYFSLEKQVRDVVHKAFWDKLREELSQDPPVFSQALSLIQEVKEVHVYMYQRSSYNCTRLINVNGRALGSDNCIVFVLFVLLGLL